jgi:predicted RNase H-like nuclease (RuvC/YqgF family)
MEVEKARLETELNNLRESNTLSRDRQVRNLRAEVAQLRQELEEAERKLDAIANIERAMERGAGDNTQR